MHTNPTLSEEDRCQATSSQDGIPEASQTPTTLYQIDEPLRISRRHSLAVHFRSEPRRNCTWNGVNAEGVDVTLTRNDIRQTRTIGLVGRDWDSELGLDDPANMVNQRVGKY